MPQLLTITPNPHNITKNERGLSEMLYIENRKVKWISCENSDSPLAPKTYVDKRITEKEVILKSSTEGSSKKFKITVDDTGTIKATEVTNN